MKQYVKVVRVDPEKGLVSSTVRNKLQLTYKKGKKTKAPDGTCGIFCFVCPADAKRFLRHKPRDKFKVFSVEPGKKLEIDWIDEECWFPRKKPPMKDRSACWITGTVFFDEIKLVKEIDV